MARITWRLEKGSSVDTASLGRATIVTIKGAFQHCEACERTTPLMCKPLPLDKMVQDMVIQLLRLNVPVAEILAVNGRMIHLHFDGHVTTVCF